MTPPPRHPRNEPGDSSASRPGQDSASTATLHGFFVLVFFVIGILVTYFGTSKAIPTLAPSAAFVVCEATFVAALGLATSLGVLIAGGPALFGPHRPPQILRIARWSFSSFQGLLAGPLAAALFLAALSGPTLLVAQSATPNPPTLILEASYFLLGAWGVLGAWTATVLIPILRSPPRTSRGGAARASAAPDMTPRPWLRPLPAILIAAILLLVVALPFPSSSGWRIDGDMSKWATVPGHENSNVTAVVTATGTQVTMDYPTPGTYEAVLNVTDSNGAQAETMLAFRIPNRPPVANISVSVLGLNVTASANASYDPDGSITTYAWQFGDGGAASGLVVAHAYYASGTYNVTLTVTDNEGASSSLRDSVSVHGPNRPPRAVITYTLQDYNLTVTAASSTDPDGSVVSYVWSFGDGATEAIESIVHRYTSNGTFSVVLTVVDNQGASSDANVSITVPHPPPVPRFTAAVNYLFVSVNATASTAVGPIAEYAWFFGEGAPAYGALASHLYSGAGNHTITLRVQDAVGAVSYLAELVTTTAPPASSLPPVPRITTTTTGLYVSFQDQGSYDPDGTIVAAYWAFGDGASAQGDTVGHLYAAPSIYTARLTLVDSEGLSATASLTVDLSIQKPSQVPPIPRISVKVAGSTVILDGTRSSAVNATIVRYLWTLPSPSSGLQIAEVKAVRLGGQLFLYARTVGPMFPLPSTQTALTFYIETSGGRASIAVDGVDASFEIRVLGIGGTATAAQLLAFVPPNLRGLPGQWYVIGSGENAVSGSELEAAVPVSALLIESSAPIRVACAAEVFGAPVSVLAQPFDA